MGGGLVAGLFLQEFVPAGTPWAHLDIAGPAFHEGEPYGYTPDGGTGCAVRTLVLLAEDTATGDGVVLESVSTAGAPEPLKPAVARRTPGR